MGEEQENIPPSSSPASRLPAPARATGIPLPNGKPLAASTTVAAKRKSPADDLPPAKRLSGGPVTGIKQPVKAARPAPSGSRPETRSSSRTGMRPTTVATRTAATRTAAPARPPATRAPVSRAPVTKPAAKPAPAVKPAVAAKPRPGVTTAAVRRPGVAGRPVARGSASSSQSSHDDPDKLREYMGDFGKTITDNIQALLEQERERMSVLQHNRTEMQTTLLTAQNQEKEARRALANASEEQEAILARHAREVEDLERHLERREREKRNLEDELARNLEELGHERAVARELRTELAEQSKRHMGLNAQLIAAQAQGTLLQVEVDRAEIAVSASKAEAEEYRKRCDEADLGAEERIRLAQAECDRRVAEIEDELRAAETIRRKLHNQVQELKGNIRVFARVRPALDHERSAPDGLADIAYCDERVAAETGQSHLTVRSRSESAMGKEREQALTFNFDKVFQPKHGQREVFEEISMLAQSVLDGYNVCIFAYGQTGSGKSWTMEGANGLHAGMIPRAIDMIFAESAKLQDRGWKYSMEGSFLEVYNDEINDLLGSGQFDTKKHEIKIDRDKMTVTETVALPLANPQQVSTLLEKARSRRAVAATLMNERSSRSHSVFALKVRGWNDSTGEESEGILNLVDLAGSERLASSGADKDAVRLKETININKSLSALADVISALGQGTGAAHVPYRNSTLTRLLQTSLSGSSKTLMLCNLSPLAAHLGETVCSLRFATKVNSTPAGTARRNLK
ncbi:hypothetical protein CcaverHIS002_0505670 [Cutaneotrichosporon cavernicola]|uniref:Kinesin motor domain-containing protein n=1 Tax=Cutaneotrichosporon cavernicola TaxID=279322 RepID=A0AA48L6T5_9TREE|nr:uncharacterized protein CcaverHIS019_0506200 [Cutaneotrichosporon cavernicola]BEI85166.1 hypothetical protein CcaverHIS002_0505670 [Cutaneotrichosporon cavernicola]BEI92992.1 hypothetical protein CcaverHIS019_0506200 [Cutaneotrichosporon cavernicola]BEJ00768.1 hypothetical protein CcaverHIS631_0506250 [Cutaneotrichosporon cavernicola]BEJ08533.1 hypothetical protein CcaverHIS641_0506270 [Cutaneotrichosporon cavernicola]